MSKKMIIRLTPKYSLKFDPSSFKLRPGWQAVSFDLADHLLSWLLPIFILFSLSFELFSNSGGSVILDAVYAITVAGMALQLIKRVLGKNEYLPQVPFDMLLLTFTTIISVSLFYHTAILKDQTNLWGGISLRAISAISLIAYWFFYYLLVANSRDKRTLGRFLKLFFWAPPLMGAVALISFRIIPASVSITLACLIPGFVILLLTQKKNLWLLLLDLVLSVIIVLSSANTTAIFAVLITFILAFFTILITKRNRILPMFRTLDKITKQELRRDFLAVVNKQALLLFFLLSLVLSLFSLFWFNRNLSTGFFNGITLGLSSLKFSGIIQVLIGNGMADSAGGKIWQLIYSYGLVPLLLLGYFLYRFTRDQITLLKSKLSLQISGLALALLSFLLTLTIFALLQNTGLELVIILSIFVVAVLTQLKQIYADKSEYQYTRELNTLKGVKGARKKLLYRISQFIIVALLLVGSIYLLCSLNYINIFLTK